MLLQVFGLGSLGLSRLLPGHWSADLGRKGAILALLGLAVAGAWCGRHCSEFALYAGGTMTVLLIGMTTGNAGGTATRGEINPVVEPRRRGVPEPKLAS